jgi:hypothetical protein
VLVEPLERQHQRHLASQTRAAQRRDGQDTKVVLPYFRARKIAVMTLRSQDEIDELQKEAAR